MNTDPRWHGWATPDQVRQMMEEMYQFLDENKQLCLFERIKVRTPQEWAYEKTHAPL